MKTTRLRRTPLVVLVKKEICYCSLTLQDGTVYLMNLWIQTTACISAQEKKIYKLGRNWKRTGHSMKTISAAESSILEKLCSHWNTKFTVTCNGTSCIIHYSSQFCFLKRQWWLFHFWRIKIIRESVSVAANRFLSWILIMFCHWF